MSSITFANDQQHQEKAEESSQRYSSAKRGDRIAHEPKAIDEVGTAVDEGRKRMRAEVTREWLTYKQAEELTGLSRTTLWKLISAGDVEAARVGRAVRINRQSLTAYMRRSAESFAATETR